MANSWGYPSEVDGLANAADDAARAVSQIRSFGGADEAAARGRLGYFWNLKAQTYSGLSASGQFYSNKLDIWVKNLWSRMAQTLSFMAAKADDSAQARYASEAQQASAAAQALVDSTNQQGSRLAASVANTSSEAKNIKAYGDANAVDARYSTAFMDQAKKVATTPLFGIPLWVWAAGGLALILLLEAGPAMASASAYRRAAAE